MKTLPQKILVIPLRFIGDTVLTLPLIENIKLAFPEADIDVLASKTTAPLLETCPFIHQVLIEKKSITAKWTQFAEGHYDLAFVLRKSV
ncbi:MAG: putative lipopolysaccharide heptosyltransferase III, partial [Cyanobacteria bacterium]|nr:putative lipopolysaccharide heptosyltransferase III [Cyanobacteriota bacterium]